MKRIFFPIAIVCLLNGCALSPSISQQKKEFGDRPYKAENGKDIGAFNNKKRLEEKEIAEAKCVADKECKRSKDLLEARKGLSWGYTMLLGINPYSQADYDYLVRNICEEVTSSQKKGVSRDALINKMRDFPGIAPRERGILTEIVGSCWDISKLSGDWREALRQN